jgi:mono/diheme cytochrome c family protein
MKRLILAVVLLLGACENLGIPWPDLERMKDQPKHKAQKQSTFFADGRAMRTPPEGTVPRERVTDEPEFTTGLAGTEFLTEYPVVINEALVNRGEDRFNIYCAVCHGVSGDGKSRISARMTLRKAPSLHLAKYQEYPPGKFFYIISKGFGLMPAYNHDLTPIDRWAVVAYLQALQMSQNVSMNSLPENLRGEAQKAVSKP